MYLHETIGWLLYQLSRVGLWKRPKWIFEGFPGYGRLFLHWDDSRDPNCHWQFPVKCLGDQQP